MKSQEVCFMAKMGRPTDAPKTGEVKCRMSAEDTEMLEACAKALGITKTEVIRKGIREIFKQIKQ